MDLRESKDDVVTAGSDGRTAQSLSLVFDLVREGGEALRKLSDSLRERGALPLNKIFLLDEVAKAQPEGVRTAKLADRLGITTSRLAHQLNILEEKGLVERRPHEADGRGILVTVTDAGLDARKSSIEVLADITDGGGIFEPVHEAAAQAAHEVLSGTPGAAAGRQAEVITAFAGACFSTLASAETLEEMFESLTTALMQLMPIDGMILSVAASAGLVVAASKSDPRWGESLKGMITPLDAKIPLAETFTTGKPIMLESPEEIADRYPFLEAMYKDMGQAVGSQFAVPVAAGPEPLGAISGTRDAIQPFDGFQTSLLELFSRALAAKIESDRNGNPDADAGPRASEPFPELSNDANLMASGIAWGIDAEHLVELIGLSDERSSSAIAELAGELGVDGVDAVVAALRA